MEKSKDQGRGTRAMVQDELNEDGNKHARSTGAPRRG
jgi:hypothetical protein